MATKIEYKPIPPSLTIKESKIHGLGLFAKEEIPKGTFLGISHYLIDNILYRTPLGGFYNHNQWGNVAKVQGIYLKPKDFVYNLKTIKHITAGEEITCRYTFYKL